MSEKVAIEARTVLLENLPLSAQLKLGCMDIRCTLVVIESQFAFNPAVALERTQAEELSIEITGSCVQQMVAPVLRQLQFFPQIRLFRVARSDSAECADGSNFDLLEDKETLRLAVQHLRYLDLSGVALSIQAAMTLLQTLATDIETIEFGCAQASVNAIVQEAEPLYSQFQKLRLLVVGRKRVIDHCSTVSIENGGASNLALSLPNRNFGQPFCSPEPVSVQSIVQKGDLRHSKAAENEKQTADITVADMQRMLFKYMQYGVPISQEPCEWLRVSATLQQILIETVNRETHARVAKSCYSVNKITDVKEDGAAVMMQHDESPVEMHFTADNSLPTWLSPEQNATLFVACVHALRAGSLDDFALEVRVALDIFAREGIIRKDTSS